MEIFGYSERGILNSLLYSLNSDQAGRCIALLTHECVSIDSGPIEVLIEHSLSDFGNPDLIIIYTKNGEKTVIFVEAKVKTSSRKKWLISDEYEIFQNGDDKKRGSNLFRQLCLKKALSDNLGSAKTGITITDQRVCGTKKIKKIGSNPVVLKTLQKIQNADRFFFIGIIPDDRENLDELTLDADTANIQFVTWKEVYEFDDNEKLKNTILNFGYNSGQIY